MSESCDEDDCEPMLDLVSIMRFDLQDLAKEKTSLYNRLRSIQDDIVFVHHVCCEYYEHLPIVPNLRCGACIIIVDSTRRGKRFPDALSKTIPIWCCVVNRAVARKYNLPNSFDTELHTSTNAVSRSEHSQIEERLDRWTSKLCESVFDLPQLSRPLRPVWISTASTIIPQFEDDLDFHPVICLSASEHVENGVERHNGYCYVQGSGDDHESWSKGLTPMMFWRNVETVRRATPETIATIVQDIVDSHSDATASPFKHLTPITKAHCMISLGIPKSSEVEPSKAMILISPLPTCIEPITSPQPRLLSLVIPAGKAGQLDLMKALTRAIAFVKLHLDAGTTVDIVGADPSDVCTGVAMAVLQALFNDAGDYTGQPASIGAFDLRTLSQQEENLVFINHPFSTAYFAGEISKQSIRKRLEWIQQSAPGMNPSRVTMNRVNEYFLSPPSMRSSLR
ncbi:hypothetical protein FRB96_001170 [Tulasnella sp. 330]|nr:hypothetical protein FRB96_001170 [Tulasnella sp. 330]